MNEIEESEKIIFEAIQKSKKTYSDYLEKKGLDESYYPIRITVFEAFEDSGFKAGKKIIERDDREIDFSKGEK